MLSTITPQTAPKTAFTGKLTTMVPNNSDDSVQITDPVNDNRLLRQLLSSLQTNTLLYKEKSDTVSIKGCLVTNPSDEPDKLLIKNDFLDAAKNILEISRTELEQIPGATGLFDCIKSLIERVDYSRESVWIYQRDIDHIDNLLWNSHKKG